MGSSIRAGLIGVGFMGRHHARLLGQLDDFEFVGAFDPMGDRHGAVRDAPVLEDLDALIDLGLDAAVVAVPTAQHAEIALRLVEAGVDLLIEKPLAESVQRSEQIRDAVVGSSLMGVVGHIERFNPALMEMKRRLDAGEIGRVFSILTERVGPFPNRIQDVGVVKDLATHDIDLAMWLGSGRFASFGAETSHMTGRPHEDLVSVVGRLDSDVVVSLIVNWLTPTKRRQVTVLGERGAFVADLLTADLTFHANAAVDSEWEALAHLSGVSEGDTIRYALSKPEPLASELRAFAGVVRSRTLGEMVSLDQGVEIVRIAEGVIAASSGRNR